MFIFSIVMENFLVRKANLEDAYWITFVQIHTWYATYKWLIPENILQARIDSINERTKRTRKFIENGKIYLVVENTETKEIVWMLTYWPSRNKKYPYSWEIIAIYILPEYQKLGIGKKLFLAWIHELINLWYNDMIINVLKGNSAINFYKKYGWIVVWEIFDEIWNETWKIKTSEDIVYFKDIKSIH